MIAQGNIYGKINIRICRSAYGNKGEWEDDRPAYISFYLLRALKDSLPDSIEKSFCVLLIAGIFAKIFHCQRGGNDNRPRVIMVQRTGIFKMRGSVRRQSMVSILQGTGKSDICSRTRCREEERLHYGS